MTAGPGTGKTGTLISWISRLVSAGYAKPGEILAITFTNRAAGEMKERLHSRLGKDGENIHISTFHSFCFDLVKERFPNVTSVFDDKKRIHYLSLLFSEMKDKEVKELSIKLKKYFEDPRHSIPEKYHVYAQKYLKEVKKCGGVDISSLVAGINQLLKKEPEILHKVRKQYTYIAIDELQDINHVQYTLISHLVPPSSLGPYIRRGILAIGDPDQAIYGFRGSDLSLYYEFKKDYTPIEIGLDTNYRSTERILKAGEGVISHNSVKKMISLKSVKGAGEKIGYYHAEDPACEGKFIAARIEQLVGGMSFTAAGLSYESGAYLYSFSDIAVLARTRAILNDIVPFLSGAGIPLSIHHAQSLMDEPPFSHVFSILSFLAQKQDIMALHDILGHLYPSFSPDELSRILPVLYDQDEDPWPSFQILFQNNRITEQQYREAGDFFSFLHALQDCLEQEGVKGVLVRIFDKYITGENQYDHISLKKEALCETAGKYGSDLAGYLRISALNPNESESIFSTDKVHLLTFHAAKGCEFPVVFIAGAQEGITPVKSSKTDIEEERRLFYVALTRAKDLIIISSASGRRVFGKWKETEPSRFISEIPAHLLLKETDNLVKQRKEKYGQPLLF